MLGPVFPCTRILHPSRERSQKQPGTAASFPSTPVPQSSSSAFWPFSSSGPGHRLLFQYSSFRRPAGEGSRRLCVRGRRSRCESVELFNSSARQQRSRQLGPNASKRLLTWGGQPRFNVHKAIENGVPKKELDLVVFDSDFLVIDSVTQADWNVSHAHSNGSAARPSALISRGRSTICKSGGIPILRLIYAFAV